ncbi:MAG: glycoside hydrolase family 16 protein [bacterium]|nr:glycoside hydrolase family 16 protein [bacterium]
MNPTQILIHGRRPILTVLLLLATAGCQQQLGVPESVDPGGEPSEAHVFFDDFSYIDPDDMSDNGWSVRTVAGIPGMAGSTWGTEGISLVQHTEEPGNQTLQLTASTGGDGPSTEQTQICHERKYLEGTYAARVRFSDEPTYGPDGDHIVETFFSITPESEPKFSEIDFEYLPNGGWGIDESTLWVTSWAPWGAVREKPIDAEWDQDNTSSNLKGSFVGWHTLVARVADDSVSYFVDDQLIGTHSNGYAPRAPLSINFNMWFDPDGLLESKTTRQYAEQIDWVYHAVDAVLSTQDIEEKVADLRSSSIVFRDTVPALDPALPSPCDL